MERVPDCRSDRFRYAGFNMFSSAKLRLLFRINKHFGDYFSISVKFRHHANLSEMDVIVLIT